MTDREFFAQLCSSEHPRFVGVLQATPEDDLDYRPHPRSRSGYELVGHLIGHEQDLAELVETGTIHHHLQTPFRTIGEAVAIFAEAHATVTRRLAATTDQEWESTGRFLVLDKLVMEASRRDLAWMVMLDAVHHRGQLSTYLRPMGGTVPSIYGPSADTVAAAV